jgi:hypothetical protein
MTTGFMGYMQITQAQYRETSLAASLIRPDPLPFVFFPGSRYIEEPEFDSLRTDGD